MSLDRVAVGDESAVVVGSAGTPCIGPVASYPECPCSASTRCSVQIEWMSRDVGFFLEFLAVK